MAHERQRWSSTIAFYFAAIGAAVGFGNVWRFPALAAQYGGGAFFIPYLMALFLIGLPLFLLETALGQFYQTGDVGVFGSFHKRMRGIGLSSVACAYMVVTYYSVLIAWVVHAFFDSFGDEDPWAQDGTSGGDAITYFLGKIIGTETLGDDGRPTRIVGRNVGWSALVWLMIWGCLAGGTKWTGRITYFTMGLPIVLMFVFLGRGASLTGSSDGITEYIGRWDVKVLSDNPDVWSTAVSQIFFSLGITFGILTAYGSYNDRNDNALQHSCVIAFSNCMFSFISGFGVFAALGHLAYLEDTSVNELDYAGFSLVFGTWPVVFGTLPGGEHWVRLLFFDLFLLGIDSGFGLLEGGLTAAADTIYLQNTPKWAISGVMCIVGFMFSLIYCTDAGLNFLDVVDFYINFVMIFVGFLEAFGAAWIYGLSNQIKTLGANAVFSYMFANFVSVFVASILWFAVEGSTATNIGYAALVLLYGGGFGAAVFFLSTNGDDRSLVDKLYDLSFGNIMDLTSKLTTTVGWIPSVWSLLMKQFIPQALLVLFINLACAKTSTGETNLGYYGGYKQVPFQIMGYGTVILASFLFIFGLILPETYAGFTMVSEEHIKQIEAGEDPVVKEEPYAGEKMMKEEVAVDDDNVEEVEA